jgi:hypothetical protein
MYCAIYGDGMAFSYNPRTYLKRLLAGVDGRFAVFCTHAMILWK